MNNHNSIQNTKQTHLLPCYSIGALVSFLLIVFDQLTKQLAVKHLKDKTAIVLLDGIFELHYLENRGAAFGVMQGKKVFFLIVTILMACFLVYAYGKIPTEKHFFSLHMICIILFSGAIGNLIDRIAHNYVIDFLYFSLIDFPIFNVADIYVTCAVVLFIAVFLFYYKETELDELTAAIFPHKHKESEL